LQEIQTFTGGRLAGITARLTVRPEEATYFDRKEKRKRTASIWALSLEVEGDDMQKLIADLTENARLFAETRKLLGSGGKVFEVVEDEQEQATEIPGEFYPASANGSAPPEGGEAGSGTPGGQSVANGKPHPPAESAEPSSVASTRPAANEPEPAAQSSSAGNGTAAVGGNGSAKPPASKTASPPALKNGNGSAAASGFNQFRNEFLTLARRVATTKKQPIAEVVERQTFIAVFKLEEKTQDVDRKRRTAGNRDCVIRAELHHLKGPLRKFELGTNSRHRYLWWQSLGYVTFRLWVTGTLSGTRRSTCGWIYGTKRIRGFNR
jgi:hypothetical protein